MTPTAEEIGRGQWAEERYRRELKAARDRGEIEFYHRPEWLVWPMSEDKPYFVEVKGQERFLAPPYDGHGLPVYQANRYMLAFLRLEIRTWLVVYEPGGDTFGGWIDELEDGEHFDTSGTRNGARRIYELSSFKQLAPARTAAA